MTLSKRTDETDEQFKLRVFMEKRNNPTMTWDDVAVVVNHELRQNSTPNKYRKEFNKKFRDYILQDCGIVDCGVGEEQLTDEQLLFQNVSEQLERIRYEKTILADLRRDANAQLRAVDRLKDLKEIARESALEISKNFESYKFNSYVTEKVADNAEDVLVLNDWHFGIEVDEYLNKYNPQICKKRLQTVLTRCIETAKNDGIRVIHVFNLSDLICGRIHAQLRMQSRIDAVEQTHQVQHMLFNFLLALSEHFQVEYYDCLDNHSRVEPNKKESLQLESFAMMIHWYIEDLLDPTIGNVKPLHPITVHENRSKDIIVANICGHKIVGVHGDKDTPSTVVPKMSALLGERPDVVCMAHRHHFCADEQNRCIVLCSPALMGPDEYALEKRLDSSPAQLMFTVTRDNPVENVYRLLAE